MAASQPIPANAREQLNDRQPTMGVKNPNWRGGRSVASNGYVLVRVGVDHHLADVRGYAYEHRVVAEQKLGRRLVPGEIVHHKDENKQNNSPDNLEVCFGNAEHFVHHRKRDDLQLPGELNPIIECACGCGTNLHRFDECGRPRKYVSGHNEHPSPTRDAIIKALRTRMMTTSEISVAIGLSTRVVRVTTSRMAKCGQIIRVSRGLYAIEENFEYPESAQ